MTRQAAIQVNPLNSGVNKKLFAFQKHIRQVNLISFFPPNFFIHGYFRVASLGEEPILQIWFSYNSRLCEYHYNHQPTILDVQLQPKAYLNKNQIKKECHMRLMLH